MNLQACYPILMSWVLFFVDYWFQISCVSPAAHDFIHLMSEKTTPSS
jgi:hypothetical protein